MDPTTRDVLAECDRLGFALAGIARAQPTMWRRELEAWLAAGKHGDMAFLAKDLDLRLDPRQLTVAIRPSDSRRRAPDTANTLPVRSFIIVADVYASRAPSPPTPASTFPAGRIARYAQGRDYHAVLRRRLHALADRLRLAHPHEGFMAFVDTTPLLERELALLAGLGWIGKHTLLIHPRLGSYLLLAGLGTSLDLTPHASPEPDHCGSCTRCIDACPTHALTSYALDARRCISYLTIEHRGPIDPAFHEPMGDWLFGCDICQDVCPHNAAKPNAPPPPPPNPDLAPSPSRATLPLLDVLSWNEVSRRRAFQRSAMKRVALPLLKRNAVIALANAHRRSPNPAWRRRLEDLAWDAREAPLVRATARAALARLDAP